MRSPNVSNWKKTQGRSISEIQMEPLSNRKICNFDDKIKVNSMLSQGPRHENVLENLGVLPRIVSLGIIPYPTAFPYGNGMVLHFYQQQESSTTKTAHKVINKGLKAYV